MTKVGPRGILPPRPNLGPEPWQDSQSINGNVLALAVLALLILGWQVFRWLRRRQSRLNPDDLAYQHRPDATPRDRLVGLSNSIRETLTVQYGSTWRAKTTKELAADTQLVQTVGPEGFDDLIRFLDRVDLLKFAPERTDQDHESLERELTVWEPRVIALKSKIRARPTARRAPESFNSEPRMAASQRSMRGSKP